MKSELPLQFLRELAHSRNRGILIHEAHRLSFFRILTFAFTLIALTALIYPFPLLAVERDQFVCPAEEYLAVLALKLEAEKAKTKKVWITAYSSSIDETDDTPFTTASNSEVREGILAANFLPFGTRVRIPKIFGDKEFIVEDRMHPRKGDKFVDVWMPSKEEATRFGIHQTEIVVLD